MHRVRSNPKVGILDHLGGGNLGDDATFATILQQVKSRWPAADVIGFSMAPADTRARHGVTAYPIRREIWDISYQPGQEDPRGKKGWKETLRQIPLLFKVIRAIKSVSFGPFAEVLQEIVFLLRASRSVRSLDVMIIGGGGQLLDSWGGAWKFPYTILKWIILARLHGAQCYVVNVGAGPLKQKLSRYFICSALSLSHYVSFRDEDSRALVERAGYAKARLVFPDCVYGLDFSGGAERHEPQRLTIVGVSPMAYQDRRRYWTEDWDAYYKLISTLAVFGDQLLVQRAHLKIFSTDISFDAGALSDFQKALVEGGPGQAAGQYVSPKIDDIEGLLQMIASLDFVVTCRFHGVVFAHLMQKPVLAISHHPKVKTLMRDLGLSEYCFDIRDARAHTLMAGYERLKENELSIRSQMADKARQYRNTLEEQFDELFGTSAIRVREAIETLSGQGV